MKKESRSRARKKKKKGGSRPGVGKVSGTGEYIDGMERVSGDEEETP